jgi:hypothetical protein
MSSLLVGCAGGERARVHISYVVEAERGLPSGMTTIMIAPAKIGPNTDAKWSDLSASILHDLVNDSRNRYGTPVTVSERRDAQVTFDEADLAAAGMSTGRPGAGGQLLAAQGAILSNINVKTEVLTGKQRTLSGLFLSGGGGHGYGHGATNVQTDEVETVTRTMTVQTEFKLVDTSNGQVWAHYSPRPYMATDKTEASPIFGSSKTEAELTPQDQIIAALVEEAATEFVSQLMPCRVEVVENVVSSGNADCAQGVKFLRAQMWDVSLSHFKNALAANQDDHRAAFGAGVACEASGQYDEALRFYQLACAGMQNDRYTEARDRMKTYGGRVRG